MTIKKCHLRSGWICLIRFWIATQMMSYSMPAGMSSRLYVNLWFHHWAQLWNLSCLFYQVLWILGTTWDRARLFGCATQVMIDTDNFQLNFNITIFTLCLEIFGHGMNMCEAHPCSGFNQWRRLKKIKEFRSFYSLGRGIYHGADKSGELGLPSEKKLKIPLT